MGWIVAETTIKWTRNPQGTPGYTFNPWWGCQRVSPGCEHCYAEAFSKRLGLPLWGPKVPRRVSSESYWQKPLAWNKRARDMGQRLRVFCGSMMDVFEDLPSLQEPRARLLRLIEDTPHLDWQLLSKRPENMVRLAGDAGWPGPWPKHAWAGCTVENQALADKRVPLLLGVPASLRFLSIEPQLEAIILAEEWLVSWVISGGESGPSARPFDLGWARSLRDQCAAAHVPFFFKQLGDNPITTPGPITWPCSTPKGEDPAEFPPDLRVQEVPELA